MDKVAFDSGIVTLLYDAPTTPMIVFLKLEESLLLSFAIIVFASSKALIG